MMVQIERSLLILGVKKPTKFWWKLVKPSGLTTGKSYLAHWNDFPSIFRKYCKSLNVRDRKSTLIDDKYLLSQDELLGNKKSIITKEANFRTHDQDIPNVTSVYNSLGNENEPRPLLNFTDRNATSTIQLHGIIENDDFREARPSDIQNQEQEIDHRFSSEGSVVNDKNENEEIKEIQQISLEKTPNKFEKPLVKMMPSSSPYDNDAFESNRIEERKSESAEKQSEIDKIHAFMDEWHEELKSMDQTLK